VSGAGSGGTGSTFGTGATTSGGGAGGTGLGTGGTISYEDIAVSSVLTPFDANSNDNVGPASWSTQYGKSPEIIVSSDGTTLEVLAQDYDEATAWDAVLLQVVFNGVDYQVNQALTDLPMLDRVMGLAQDEAGHRYYATGVDEDAAVNASYPPLNTWRNDIVRVVKLDGAGEVLFNIDLDTARYAHDFGAEPLINPMVASTARLAVGSGEVALVHGNNTDPDGNIGGARHQKAVSTRLSAATGDITRVSSVWCSHSFDQRLLHDGNGIVEYHLGDSYPRYLLFNKAHSGHSLFDIKGAGGDNNTYTRLGNLALIESDPTYKYIALFASESNDAVGSGIQGPRNLGIVRVHGSDSSVDPALPDTLSVTSAGASASNKLRWLTDYSAESNLHAERPKIVAIGGDQYVVLWEQWLNDPTANQWSADTFQGVYAMVIDDAGAVLQAAKLVSASHHLHRGDDAFLLNGQAGWMTGNAAGKELYLHLVDASLSYQMYVLD
jgi:hypothetical protein